MQRNISLTYEPVVIQPSPHMRRGTAPATFDGCLLAMASTKIADGEFYSTVAVYLLPDATFRVHHERHSPLPCDCRTELLYCGGLQELLRTLWNLDAALQQRYNEAFRNWDCPLSFNDTDTGEEPLTC